MQYDAFKKKWKNVNDMKNMVLETMKTDKYQQINGFISNTIDSFVKMFKLPKFGA